MHLERLNGERKGRWAPQNQLTPACLKTSKHLKFWCDKYLITTVHMLQGVDREGPRGINRHRYTPEEAAAELDRPVVKALHQMCRFRNRHPAFNGQVSILGPVWRCDSQANLGIRCEKLCSTLVSKAPHQMVLLLLFAQPSRLRSHEHMPHMQVEVVLVM